MVGQVYSGLPPASAWLLGVASVVPWVSLVGPLRRRGPWFSAPIVAIVTIVPVAIAVGLAVAASPSYE